MMLGARRTTVTLIAGVLQRSGLIEYKRGRVTILDRENLEAAACDCYKITKALYTGSLPPGTSGSGRGPVALPEGFFPVCGKQKTGKTLLIA